MQDTSIRSKVYEIGKRLQLIAFMMSFSGFLLFYLRQSFSGMLLTVGLLTWAITAYILALSRPVQPDENLRDRSLMRIAGLSSATMLVGLLFKLQFWPGDKMLLNVGIATMLVSLLIGLIRKIRFERNLVQLLLYFSFILGLLAWQLPGEALLVHRYPQDPQLLQLYRDFQANPDDPQIKTRYFERLSQQK
jgi:hypothetical protein